MSSRTAYSPTASISKWNDMLVFNSWADFDQTLGEVTSLTPAEANDWETSINFLSQRKIFWQVTAAEDSVSNYIEGLSQAQQDSYAAQPEIHSSTFSYWLQQGVVKYVTDPSDNSTYWDYSLVQSGVAPLVNDKGLVKVEGKIVQFTQDSLIKVILDGNYSKVANLPNLTHSMYNGTYAAYSGVAPRGGNECVSNDWSKTNNWVSAGNKKRAKVELVGFSTGALFTPSGGCQGAPYAISCVDKITTQAQKKNIWGNFKYSLDFQPSLTISNGDWNYNYFLFASGCAGNLLDFTNNLTGQWPKPLWNKSVPATNNRLLAKVS